MPWSSPDSACAGHCRTLAAPVWPLVLSHGQEQPLFPQAQIIAQAIGQAFGVAYQRFLEANSIDPSELTPRQYSRALEDQEQYNAELTHFSRQENCKDVSAALEEWGQCGVPAGTSVLSPPQLPEQLSCSLQSWALSQLAVSLEHPCCSWDAWPRALVTVTHLCPPTGLHPEAEGGDLGHRYRGVRLGLHPAHSGHRQPDARGPCGAVGRAEHRGPPHVCQWDESGGAAPHHLPEHHPGELGLRAGWPPASTLAGGQVLAETGTGLNASGSV